MSLTSVHGSETATISILHKMFDIKIKGGGGGGGGGVTLMFFVKLNFEIAVDQQTRARDRIFEGVPDSGCLPVPAGHFSEFGRQFF